MVEYSEILLKHENNNNISFTCHAKSICKHKAWCQRTLCRGSHVSARTLHSFPSHRHLDDYHATAGPALEGFHPSTPIVPPLRCLSYPRTLFHHLLEVYQEKLAHRNPQCRPIRYLD